MNGRGAERGEGGGTGSERKIGREKISIQLKKFWERGKGVTPIESTHNIARRGRSGL